MLLLLKDHDGKISFDEFADFFVARDWGFDAANMTEEDKLRFVTGRRSESKLGEFEWDFGKTYDDNVKAMGEAKQAEKMTGGSFCHRPYSCALTLSNLLWCVQTSRRM
jgi:hypothetical protein